MRISDWSSDVCSSDLLVHDVLERLWLGWREQRTLQALGDTELQAQVGTAVDDALTALQNKAPQRLQPVMRELEAQRLRELILAWLVVERERARSEEHTSELQSLMRISYAVFCLKKKKK